MARQNRCDAIDESTVGVYHCINRCVRRAFLCGEDPVSGNNYDHRKDWIQRRLEFLAGQFAIDVIGFSVMSNHFHTILRNRPDVVASWSDSEVARRWFARAVGRPPSMEAERERCGRNWLQGISHARQAFA